MNRPGPPQDSLAALLAQAGQQIARGDAAGARGVLESVLRQSPEQPDALFQLAWLEVAANRPQAAIVLLERCVAARPAWAEPWGRLGQLRLMLNMDAGAVTAFEQATALAPREAAGFEGLAESLRRVGQDFAALVRARTRLAQLQPREVEHRLRLGYTLTSGDLAEAAHAAYRDALEVDPSSLVARWALFQNLAHAVFPDQAAMDAHALRWSDGLAQFEALDLSARSAAEIQRAIVTATDFALHYQPGPLRAERSRYADALARLAHAAIPAPAPQPRPSGTRRRVGLVSAFFRRHSVTKVLGGLIEGLDAERFEVGIFHLDPRRDALSARYAASAATYPNLQQRPREVLDAIARFAPDVLVFLDIGMDPLSQVLACYRLAPLQLALWGHPLTTGHAQIDALLVGALMDPPDSAAHYRERVLHLPNLGTCYRMPAVNARESTRRDTVDFLLAQMVLKITPAHDALLARIAQQLPQARFHIAAHPRVHVREALAARIGAVFAAHGLDASRHVQMLGHVPEAQFLATAAGMDVNLDSIGWSGGVSSFDVLAQDLPTITVDTPTLRGRQTAAMLQRIGVPELVCADADAYVERAIALGRDRDLREHLRERIAASKHVLYDDQEPVRAFAEVLANPRPPPQSRSW
jgi:protein O-GlcNAc transferase